MSQNLDTLPPQIVLPTLLTSHVRGSAIPPEAIQSAAELPERLFFGDLDESSFQASGNTWSARYRGAFETGGLLSFNGRQVVIKQTFLGVPMLSACHVTSLGGLLRVVGINSQAPLDNALQDWIGARMNVRVAPIPEEVPSAWYYPDGPARDIWLPVPTTRTRDLAKLHWMLGGLEPIGASLRGSFILGTSVVNYIEGRNGPNFEDPDRLCITALQALGLPPLDMPIRQQGADGSAAWTVSRMHYYYRLTGFLRDIPVLLDVLHRMGFVGSPGASDAWPDAPEYAALVLAPEMASAMDHLAWFDADRTRRVYLPTLDRNPAGIAYEFNADALNRGLEIVDAVTEELRAVFQMDDTP